MAATVEDPAWIDDHAGRMHFPGHYAPGLNLHATLSENHSIEAAGNDHAVAFDLAFHFGAVAKDHRLLRDDVALDITIDAERAGDRQRSFQGYALIDESRPLFTACAFCHVAVFFGGSPLPWHFEFSRKPHHSSTFNRPEKQVNATEVRVCRTKDCTDGQLFSGQSCEPVLLTTPPPKPSCGNRLRGPATSSADRKAPSTACRRKTRRLIARAVSSSVAAK